MSEETLFIEALEIADPAARAAFLDRACAGNPDLRGRLDRLLGRHARAGGILDRPAPLPPTGALDAPAGRPTEDPPAARRDGGAIGPYKLVEVIGEGGMGTVWLAQQTDPVKRLVALKVIKAGMDSRQVLARFEAERQALAMMDHPNIARVLDGGATDDGRPYFVMELVKGVPVTKFCDERRLTPRERLELFVPVCHAVQHAHQKGVIHRDIKPSNVLVALYDGRPVPKVIDFGIAKATGQPLTERTLVTGLGAVVGTPEYMSPEQAELNQLDIDTRSDVYSLGVLLYELLTGTTPLQRKRVREAALLEVLRLVREEEPPRPSTRLSTTDELPSIAANRGVEPRRLSGLVRGELDWIVMKALEKDRSRRYETANGFAADVLRYLADEPVAAGPPGAAYRLRKFARRNRAGLAAAAALGLLLVIAGALAWHADRQAAQRRFEGAERERDEQARLGRNAEAVAALLDQCEASLRANRANRAAFDLEAAERRAAEGGAENLADRLALCRADLRLLRALDRVDTFRWTEWSLDTRQTKGDVYVPLFRDALAAYGLSAGADPPAEVAARLARSHVRDRALTALDQWLCVAEPSPWVRAVLRAADPDPYRDAVRDAWAARNGKALVALVEKPEALAQPARFAVALGLLEFTPKDRARAILEGALWSEPGHLSVLIDLYGTYPDNVRAGADERLRWAQAAVAAHPGSVVAHNTLGVALRDRGEFDAALARFREAIRLDPRFVRGYFNSGIVLRDQKKWDAAADAFREAAALDPRYATAHAELGFVRAKKGDHAGARAALRDAVAIAPKDAEPHYYSGLVLEILGDKDGALAAYRTATELDPKHLRATNNLGVALFTRGDPKRGDLDAAAAAFRTAAALDPKDALAPHNLGLVLLTQGDRDGAMASFRRAVDLDERYPAPVQSLGALLIERKGVYGAVALFRRAVRANPDYLDGHINLGALLCDDVRDYEGAAYHFREAIRLAPKHPGAHLNLGNALRGLNDLPGAAAAYRAALDLAPNYIDALFNLGHTLLELGNPDGAVATLRKYVRLNGNDVNARNLLGLALKAQGDADGAVAEFRAALRIDPKLAHAHANLAWVLATGPDRVRDGKKAVEHATRACGLNGWKDPDTVNTLAAAHAEAGAFDKATEFQRQALDFPEYAKAQGEAARERLALYARKKPYRDPVLFRAEVAPPPREGKR